MKLSIEPELPNLEFFKKALKDQGIEVDVSIADEKYTTMLFKLYEDLDVPQIYDKPKSNSKYMRNK